MDRRSGEEVNEDEGHVEPSIQARESSVEKTTGHIDEGHVESSIQARESSVEKTTGHIDEGHVEPAMNRSRRAQRLSIGKKYLLYWGIFLLLMLLGLSMLRLSDYSYTDIQMNEMITMHPEQEDEIRQSFSYYHDGKNEMCMDYGIFIIVITAAAMAVFYSVYRKDKKNRRQDEQDNMLWLIEQLEQLRKGEYHIKPLSEAASSNLFTRERHDCETDSKAENSFAEDWEGTENSLRELGFCLELMKDRLTKEENNIKALISDISHQLKTPLASLRMSHELACEEGLSQTEREEFLIQETVEIHRLEVLLQELVNLSRLENHMIQIHPEHFNIRKTITEALGAVIVKAHEKWISLQVNMDEDITVMHDSKWTAEAISNVLENAVKYSEPGTTVTLSVQRIPKLVVIDVEDEGIGIRTEESHRLFQRFYRGQEATHYAKDGAGIGLYLTRRILEEQGGTITARKKQGKGSVFRLTLPL